MSRVFELSIEADLKLLKNVRSFIDQSGSRLGAGAKAIGDLCLVVDEAVTNIIQHGYGGREGSVNLQFHREGDAAVVRIRDAAPPFDDTLVHPPKLETSLSERKFGGMGVYLIRKLTDEAEYRSLPDGGNVLRLVKHGVFPE